MKYKPITYEVTYIYPAWANVVGWLMVLTVIVCVPLVAAKVLYQETGGFIEVYKLCDLILNLAICYIYVYKESCIVHFIPHRASYVCGR